MLDAVTEALKRPGYGGSACEILDSCQLVAQADKELNIKEIIDLREKLNISERIWKRMISLAHNQVITELCEKLPASFSALYRINLLPSHEQFIGITHGEIHKSSTTREIESWAKRRKIFYRYSLSDQQIYLFVGQKLSPEDLDQLIAEVNVVAREYGACFDTDNLEEIRKKDAAYQYDKRLKEIEARLVHTLKEQQILEEIHSDEIDEFDSLEDLYSAFEGIYLKEPFSDFVQTLKGISKSRQHMMEEYGEIYCLKIAQEYWRTDSRSQRYNYKRRLKDVQEKYPDLSSYVQGLFREYIDV